MLLRRHKASLVQEESPDLSGEFQSAWEIAFQGSPRSGFSPIGVEVKYRAVNSLGQIVTDYMFINESNLNVFGNEAQVPFQFIWDGNDTSGYPVAIGTYFIQATITIEESGNGDCEGDKNNNSDSVSITS